MQQDRQNNKNLNPGAKQGIIGTNPEKIKQDIQKDLREGQGAMTSREAGAMRD